MPDNLEFAFSPPKISPASRGHYDSAEIKPVNGLDLSYLRYAAREWLKENPDDLYAENVRTALSDTNPGRFNHA